MTRKNQREATGKESSRLQPLSAARAARQVQISSQARRGLPQTLSPEATADEPPAGRPEAGDGTQRQRCFEILDKITRAPRHTVVKGAREGSGGEVVEPGRAERDREVLLAFRLIAQGRLSGLSVLYDLMGSRIFGYVRMLVKSSLDPEDVVQEVFVKLAENHRLLARVKKPIPYLYAMSRNLALSSLKASRRTTSGGGSQATFVLVDHGRKDCALTPREAEAALEKLPAAQREVIVLKIYEGFTFEQIGALTQVSANTAASRYRYALAKLAELLRHCRES